MLWTCRDEQSGSINWNVNKHLSTALKFCREYKERVELLTDDYRTSIYLQLERSNVILESPLNDLKACTQVHPPSYWSLFYFHRLIEWVTFRKRSFKIVCFVAVSVLSSPLRALSNGLASLTDKCITVVIVDPSNWNELVPLVNQLPTVS